MKKLLQKIKIPEGLLLFLTAIIGLGLGACLCWPISKMQAPADDPAALEIIKQTREVLHDGEAPIRQLLADQQKQIDSLKQKDSIAAARYSELNDNSKEILKSLIQKQNEKVTRIYNFNSDSLRRAYAEPVNF